MFQLVLLWFHQNQRFNKPQLRLTDKNTSHSQFDFKTNFDNLNYVCPYLFLNQNTNQTIHYDIMHHMIL